MTVTVHQGDLPKGFRAGDSVAIDSETMGLKVRRDRLCMVQLSAGDGNATLVQFRDNDYKAPRLRALLADPKVTKLFHFARFDVAMLREYLGVVCAPIYCTKIASRLCRTYTDRHGLKDLCRDLLGVEISKQQQTSDWGAADLSPEQIQYAASDVLHLHALRRRLDGLLERENRVELAQACFAFLPHRAELDRIGWTDEDIFEH